MRILLIEDDETISSMIKELLENDGNVVKEARDGKGGLDEIDEFCPELIILDLNLPDIDGMKICTRLRNGEFDNSPSVIIISGDGEQEKVREGFVNGADDYIKKPFDMYELLLRVKVAQRRLEKNVKKKYKYENILIDREHMSVYDSYRLVTMKRKEIELLIYLIVNKGLTLSRNKIMNEVWEREYYDGDRVVDVTIRRIKDALPSLEEKIVNIRGIGYRLTK